MKFIRKIHLYLGCFFTPILVFFCLTGILQTLGLNHGPKEGAKFHFYAKLTRELTPPHTRELKSLGYEKLNDGTLQQTVNIELNDAYAIFVIIMALGIIITSIFGVVMAYNFKNKWTVTSTLIIGTALPFLLYFLTK